MGYRAVNKFEQAFTDTDRIVVNHNLELEFPGVRILIGNEVEPESVFALNIDQEDPTNTVVVLLKQPETGIVQIVSYDVQPVGVQSASLIAFEGKGFNLQFGTDYFYVEDLTRQTTNSVTFVQRLRLNAMGISGGRYHIAASFTWDLDRIDRDILARLEVDDTDTIWEMVEEPTDAAITQQRAAIGLDAGILLLPGDHTVDLDFAVSSPPAIAGIDQARIEFWRI